MPKARISTTREMTFRDTSSRFFSHRTAGLSSQARISASTKGISRDTSGMTTNTSSSTAATSSTPRIPSRSQSRPRWGQVSMS